MLSESINIRPADNFYFHNTPMTLNDLFKASYGKDWAQASFTEKLEAVVFGILLFHFLVALFSSKS